MTKPLWRRAVDEFDAFATPVAASVVRSDAFVSSLAVLVRGRLAVGHRAGDLSRRLFHALNLPAGSDINRLLAQTASVERSVRQLTKAMEDRP